LETARAMPVSNAIAVGPNRLDLLKQGSWKPLTTEEPGEETRDADKGGKGPYLICALCGYRITSTGDRIKKNGSHIHTFANPHGYFYRFGCFLTAPGCVAQGEESAYFSWFPDYSWQIVLCGRCGIHMGWKYRSESRQFHGLLLERLVEDRQLYDDR